MGETLNRRKVLLTFTTLPLFREDITFESIAKGLPGQPPEESANLTTGAALLTRSPLMMQAVQFDIIVLQELFKTYDPNKPWDKKESIIPMFTLLVNPQSINVTKNVIQQKILTRGGFVVQFWGHDLETISIKTYSGYYGNNPLVLKWFEYFKNKVYGNRFSHTEPFKGNPLVYILYSEQVLQGYFNNFNYSLSADRPYVIDFEFTFTVVKARYLTYLKQIREGLDIGETLLSGNVGWDSTFGFTERQFSIGGVNLW
jgi:hypothetical protein